MAIATRTGTAIADIATVNATALAGIETIDGIEVGGAAVTFSDDFTRANANPDNSPNWTQGPGTWANCQIFDNEAYGTAGDSAARVKEATATFSANQYSEVVLGSGNGGTTSGPAVRMASPTDGSCYWARVVNSTTIRIFKTTDSGGVLTDVQLGADIVITSSPAGTAIGLSATGAGTTTLELFRAGVSVTTRSDSTSPFTTGQPGYVIDNDSSSIASYSATDI